MAIITFIVKLKKAYLTKEELPESFEALTDGLNQKNVVSIFWKPLTLIRWLVTITIYVQLSKNCVL
jgi:hypothetical protein